MIAFGKVVGKYYKSRLHENCYVYVYNDINKNKLQGCIHIYNSHLALAFVLYLMDDKLHQNFVKHSKRL